MLTPDSSRFWDAKSYKPGQSQPSYDKQPVRDWLTASGWNKEPPAPMLPLEVIESTSRIYRTAFERLTGKKLSLNAALVFYPDDNRDPDIYNGFLIHFLRIAPESTCNCGLRSGPVHFV